MSESGRSANVREGWKADVAANIRGLSSRNGDALRPDDCTKFVANLDSVVEAPKKPEQLLSALHHWNRAAQ